MDKSDNRGRKAKRLQTRGLCLSFRRRQPAKTRGRIQSRKSRSYPRIASAASGKQKRLPGHAGKLCSGLGRFGFRIARQCKTLLREGMVELICSDSHDVRNRPPELSRCFQVVQKKFGQSYAQALFCDNGKKLLQEGALQEEFDDYER